MKNPIVLVRICLDCIICLLIQQFIFGCTSDIPVSSVTIQNNTKVLYLGETVMLTATVLPENATNPTISWYSSYPDVADVSSSGVVTAKTEGVTTISAIAGEVRDEIKLSVEKKVIKAESVALSASSVEIEMGEDYAITATIYPPDSEETEILWTSSDTSVATVSQEGIIKAITAGNTEITALVGNVFAKCAVSVKPISEDRIIYYTTINNQACSIDLQGSGGLTVQSNTYENGKGKIVFSESLRKIWSRAFSKNQTLKSVSLPQSVKTIDIGAFYYCENLKSIALPDTMTSIGGSAFYYCPLDEIRIPYGIKSIDGQTFMGCEDLKKVVLSETVESIGPSAFHGCTSLKDIAFPQGLMVIGLQAFQGCVSLKDITFPEGLKLIEGYAFSVSGLERVNFAEQLRVIGMGAFAGTALKEVVLPPSVESLEPYVFSGCKELSHIILPSNLSVLSGSIFRECESLEYVDLPQSLIMIDHEAFYKSGIAEIFLPESVDSIGYFAFSGCVNLNRFSGKYASDDGRYIKKMNRLIGFAPYGLTEYSFPKDIISVSEGVFHSIYSQIRVSFSDVIEEFDTPFIDCPNFSIVIWSKEPPVIRRYFYIDSIDKLTSTTCPNIYVPSETLSKYKQNTGLWRLYEKNIYPIE